MSAYPELVELGAGEERLPIGVERGESRALLALLRAAVDIRQGGVRR